MGSGAHRRAAAFRRAGDHRRRDHREDRPAITSSCSPRPLHQVTAKAGRSLFRKPLPAIAEIVRMNRRYFLMGTAARPPWLSVKPGSRQPQRHRPDRLRGRARPGQQHIKEYLKMPNVEIAAICDIDESIRNKRLGEIEAARTEAPGGLRRSAQAAGRQEHRRDLDRHAQPQPHAAGHLGVPGRQRRLRREALLAQYVRDASRLSRRRTKYDRIVQQGSQEPLQPGAAGSRAEDARRRDRRRLHGARALLQMARHHRPHAGGAGAGRRRLRSVAGPRAAARLHPESFPLQLALVLGLRQWRSGQPGHS